MSRHWFSGTEAPLFGWGNMTSYNSLSVLWPSFLDRQESGTRSCTCRTLPKPGVQLSMSHSFWIMYQILICRGRQVNMLTSLKMGASNSRTSILATSHGISLLLPTNNLRPHEIVLRGLSFVIKPGQYVALVGPSGCGKSTVAALIERFYDPVAGQVLIDDLSVSAYNLADCRRNLGLVSQEPT